MFDRSVEVSCEGWVVLYYLFASNSSSLRSIILLYSFFSIECLPTKVGRDISFNWSFPSDIIYFNLLISTNPWSNSGS